MQSIQHHKRSTQTAAPAKRSRTGKRSEHHRPAQSRRTDQSRAKTFFYHPDKRPGLTIKAKGKPAYNIWEPWPGDVTEDLLYRGSGF